MSAPMNRWPIDLANVTGFKGRSRSTGEGGPRERRVTFADGTETWAEEASILWDAAEAATR